MPVGTATQMLKSLASSFETCRVVSPDCKTMYNGNVILTDTSCRNRGDSTTVNTHTFYMVLRKGPHESLDSP